MRMKELLRPRRVSFSVFSLWIYDILKVMLVFNVFGQIVLIFGYVINMPIADRDDEKVRDDLVNLSFKKFKLNIVFGTISSIVILLYNFVCLMQLFEWMTMILIIKS